MGCSMSIPQTYDGENLCLDNDYEISIRYSSQELVDAIKERNFEAIKEMIEAGEDVTIAMCKACRTGDVELILSLVVSGTDVNKPCTRCKWTPLNKAILYKQQETIKVLKTHGARTSDSCNM
jgi:hypothetical protein